MVDVESMEPGEMEKIDGESYVCMYNPFTGKKILVRESGYQHE